MLPTLLLPLACGPSDNNAYIPKSAWCPPLLGQVVLVNCDALINGKFYALPQNDRFSTRLGAVAAPAGLRARCRQLSGRARRPASHLEGDKRPGAAAQDDRLERISAVRASRRAFRALLSMRYIVDGIRKPTSS